MRFDLDRIKMNCDEFGEIINGNKTYKTVAEDLKNGHAVLIGWTDKEFTHYDVLLQYTAKFYGTNIQRGMKPYYLYVSVLGIAATGFEINSEKSIGYVQEKLNMTSDCTKLAELINGIIRGLNNGSI